MPLQISALYAHAADLLILMNLIEAFCECWLYYFLFHSASVYRELIEKYSYNRLLA